jgi:hypothetical protein
MTDANRYPALLLARLTPIYDLFARLFMSENRIKRDLIVLACIAPDHCVLDLGRGRMVAPLVRCFEPISNNLGGLLPVLFRAAGFASIAEMRSVLRDEAISYPTREDCFGKNRLAMTP